MLKFAACNPTKHLTRALAGLEKLK